MIRLPELMPKKEKMNRMDKLIDDLDLRGCLDTKLNPIFYQKRAWANSNKFINPFLSFLIFNK
jgi:hypothetical protein